MHIGIATIASSTRGLAHTLSGTQTRGRMHARREVNGTLENNRRCSMAHAFHTLASLHACACHALGQYYRCNFDCLLFLLFSPLVVLCSPPENRPSRETVPFYSHPCFLASFLLSSVVSVFQRRFFVYRRLRAFRGFVFLGKQRFYKYPLEDRRNRLVANR